MRTKIEVYNKRIKTIGTILLLITSIIWGFTFVAQSEGMSHIGPLTFNAVRYLMGAVFLLPLYLTMKFLLSVRYAQNKNNISESAEKNGIKAGIKVGFILAVAGSFQQAGIAYTTVAKAGFISVLYIIIIPILYAFMGRKSNIKVWLGVVLAVVGFYFLSINGSFKVSKGDLLLLISAFCYAFHIMAIDKYAKTANAVVFSIIQFITASFISGVLALIFENISRESLYNALPYVFFAGVVSCGIAYTLQIVGQKYVPPTIAALIMSLESVFAIAGGYIFLSQTVSLREGIGCFLVFCAVVLAQIPTMKKFEKKDSLYKKV